jgi:hypothetical protein
MSKSAEDILKEMESVDALAEDIDAVVRESELSIKEASKPAPKKVAEPAKPAGRAIAGTLDMKALLTPAYRPDFDEKGVDIPKFSPETLKAAIGPETTTIPASARPAPATASASPLESVIESAPAYTPPAEAAAVESAPKPPLPSGDRAGVSVLPATGKLLEQVSSALELILTGVMASAQQAKIGEQDEQIGIVSMVLGNIRKAKNQVDGILGR